MKLQLKLAIYNALSKVIILLAFGFFLPLLVQKIVYDHIDQRLQARVERVMKMVGKGGLDEIILEQDCSYESYNILKEEFVAVYPLATSSEVKKTEITNEDWSIEGEKLRHRIIRQSFLYDNQLYELNIGEGLSTVDQLNKTINKFTLLATIIVVIISIFIDIGFVGILLKPFNRIVETKLKKTKDPTNYNFKPVQGTTYEFNYLDNSIDEMMKKIQNAFLIEKEFISNVSHELLTPISILKSRFENMLTDEKVPEEVAIKIEESQRTLNRLSKIIRSLLMISQIENAQYLKKEKTFIQPLLKEIIEEIEHRAEEKSVTIHTHFESDLELEACNKTLLFTMIFNIINNAIKYNKENGRIDISTKKENERFVLEIKDTGKGIEKDQLGLIFDRFKRFHESDGYSYGLGLPIVKTVANFHNIEIKVESEVNEGSTFKLYFN